MNLYVKGLCKRFVYYFFGKVVRKEISLVKVNKPITRVCYRKTRLLLKRCSKFNPKGVNAKNLKSKYKNADIAKMRYFVYNVKGFTGKYTQESLNEKMTKVGLLLGMRSVFREYLSKLKEGNLIYPLKKSYDNYLAKIIKDTYGHPLVHFN